MRWRYGLSWAVFLVGVGVVAFFAATNWLERVITFFTIVTPIAIWARLRLGPLPRDGYR